MRILIILFFGILSYLLVFLPGFFLFLPGEKNFLSDLSHIKDKTEKLSLKNPGKPPPKK